MSERPSVLRRQRGYGGGQLRGGPILNLPTPIPAILFWTVLVFFASIAIRSPFSGNPLFIDLAFVPIRFLALIESGAVALAVIPLITHIFLHGSLGHLALNMLWLMVFGSGIARRLCVEGVPPPDRTRNMTVFLGFYLACGLAGALTHFAAHPFDPTPMVGASGAISGLMAGTLRFALRLYAPMGAEYGKLASLWARPVVMASLLYVGLNAGTGIVGSMGIEGAAMIAWEAHIGGYVFGLIAFPLFDRLAKRPPLPFGLG
jgi:membrane associated rhomboid family serine protease